MRLSSLTLAIAGLLVNLPAAADTLTYNGHLEAGNAPANGRYDLRLAAHGDAKFGAPLAAPIEFPAVAVTDGAFRVEFELPPGRDEAWVELAVRAAGESVWSSIPGRTKATAAPSAIGQCWSSTGDDGSNPALNFLGTTDAQPLVLRTRNVQSLRIEPSTVLFGGAPITANVIAGSSANGVTAGVRGATIAGGGVPSGDSDPNHTNENPNRVTDNYGTIGGGYANVAGDNAGTVSDRGHSTVGGGLSNTASGEFSSVAGGTSNFARGVYAAVNGGSLNNAAGEGSAVGGGIFATASGSWSTVAGGFENSASGRYSAVSGGERNCAGGSYSWANGRNAKVRPGSNSGAAGDGCSGIPTVGTEGDRGTFVWADSQDGPFVSNGSDQFLIRADGGLFFNTNSFVSQADDVTLRARPLGGDADMDLRLVSRTGKSINLYVSDSTGTANIVPASLTAGSNRLAVGGGVGGNATLTNGGTWTNASSRSFKEGFTAIDPLDVLNRLLVLPITRWEYTGSTEGLHLGPMAEDFKAAFGLAGDGKSIATVDADGVALAAIQGLNAKLEAEQAENDKLRLRIEALERALAGLVTNAE